MPDIYDVVIVGAGPAGIFTALGLEDAGLSVLLVDKGSPLYERIGADEHGQIVPEGFGGGGGFSDGKLIFSHETGGRLGEIVHKKVMEEYLQRVRATWLADFLGEGLSAQFDIDDKRIPELVAKANAAGLELIPSDIVHVGSDNLVGALQRMYDKIQQYIDIRMRMPVGYIGHNPSGFRLWFADGSRVGCTHLVLAPGRGGARWLREKVHSLGAKTYNLPADIGVRVEVPAEVTDPLTDVLYEFKLKRGDTRTFCVCPHGTVIVENVNGLRLVNGHSGGNAHSPNTNFALLTSELPMNSSVDYAIQVAKLVNALSGGVAVQRLGDLQRGRSSTVDEIDQNKVRPTLRAGIPGNVGVALSQKVVVATLDCLRAMDNIMPGIDHHSTLIYAPEVKTYGSTLKVDAALRTSVDDLYTIGDGAGISRGIVQACMSGLLVADTIKND